ncbi:MAG: C25 family cysteine peptidase [candidate division Zixibacteria bacterium]|nr:C25 family cysteine peptidase [candidate division Zixibacteria bacterium]
MIKIQRKLKATNAGAIALITLLMVMIGTTVSAAEQQVVDYSFERPEIEKVTIEGENYDRIIMENTPNCGDIGQPALPAMGARILLPLGSEVKNIDIEWGEKISLGSNYFIEPVTKPIKLSATPGTTSPAEPDPSIYESDQPFPNERFQNIGVQNFRGYQILTLKLQPMEYIPTTGDLFYYPNLTVVVNTVDIGKEATLYRGFEDDYQQVLPKVDNPLTADTYSAIGKLSDKSFDLLIITTTDMAASFQPLKDYHDANGFTTEIHTTADIGSSDPEDIRDYIRDRYLADGIQYVIIGADDDIIPAVDLYVRSWDGAGAEIEYNMPSDIYFACLDGTYNYDGDSNWGEPTDGAGGGDVDLVAEVYVGRASVGNTTEADRFVDKTIQYLTTSSIHLQDVLMVGEYLGFGGVSDYAKTMMEQNVDGSSADGYTTVGIPSDVYNVDGLYEQDYTWPQSDLVNNINSGIHILNHLGHGSPDYAMKLYNSDVISELSNTDHCFVYSQTCLAGHFDGTDCWAEYMNIKTDAGAFGVIMNARYGWGSGGSTDGPNQRFNREFWDAVFSSAEGKAQLGPANHDSKEDNLYRVNESCMRWCYYEITLFGDPTVAIRGVRSITFSYPSGIPDVVSPSQTTTFSVIVSGVGDGVPIAGTGQLHYIINGGPVQTVPMVEIIKNEYEATLPALSCGDELEFYVSAEEAVNGRVYNPDPSEPHSVIVASSTTAAFEDDFETDKGWSISGGSWSRGTPTGGGGEYGNPDPSSGHDGSASVFGYNLSGDYENNMSERHLTSPAIDCSDLMGVHLNLWRWLGVEQPQYDHAYIRVSNDGLAWTTIWENASEVSDASWSEIALDISAIADGESTVYVRFTMGSTDGGWRYCGWNIDDFDVTGYTCGGSNAPTITTVDVPDWTSGIPYSEQLNATGGTGIFTWSDKYGDLSGTGLTLSSVGVLSGTPAGAGTISFTAEVTDEALETDIQLISFEINPAVSITTTSLPEWTAGVSYSEQLTATGGTGALSWSDKNSDLDATGLSLSSDGQLTGTPLSDGTINFTAEASDLVGASGEKALTISINPAVSITTESLPDGTEGEAYSEQLSATGGTGALAYSDKNGDFASWGLAISAEGLISGTPNDTGTVTFTVHVEDGIGSFSEGVLSFQVVPAYICGDVNNDGSNISVADITYLVEYLFNGGPPPPVIEAADVNSSDTVNVSDVTYLVAYLFNSGPAPEC